MIYAIFKNKNFFNYSKRVDKKKKKASLDLPKKN